MKTFNFAGNEVTATSVNNTIWITCPILGWNFNLNATPNRELAEKLYALIVTA